MSKMWIWMLAVALLASLGLTSAQANVAVGKSYTLTPAPASGYADAAAYLTNGQAAAGSGSFWGVNQVGWSDLNGTPIEVVVDLGQTYTGLTSFEAVSYNMANSWIVPVAGGTVSISTNGTDFTAVGDLAQISTGGADEARPFVLEVAAGQSARYVKFSITTSAASAWTMLSEVKVSQSAAWGRNLVAGKSYTASAAPGASYADSGSTLVDGVKALGPTSFFSAPHVGWQDLNGTTMSLTLDLGMHWQDLQHFELNSYRWDGSGILLPREVSVWLSLNGTDFTKAGVMELGTNMENYPAAYALDLPGMAHGRYVRFDVATAEASAWTMISEVAAYRVSNAAKLAAYTLTPAPHASYPDTAAYLTDGDQSAGAASFFNSHQVGWNGLNGTPVEVVVDLGAEKAGIEQMAAVSYLWSDSAIKLPVSGTVAVSSDGAAYTPAGSLVLIARDALTSNGPCKFVCQPAAPVTARYVKFTLQTAADSGWTALGEVQVLTQDPIVPVELSAFEVE